MLFKEQNHSLGLSFKGNSKKTKAKLEKIASRLKSNSKFNDTPCGDILCQHYNFSTKRKGSIPDSKPIVIYDPYSPTEEPATKKQHRDILESNEVTKDLKKQSELQKKGCCHLYSK